MMQGIATLSLSQLLSLPLPRPSSSISGYTYVSMPLVCANVVFGRVILHHSHLLDGKLAPELPRLGTVRSDTGTLPVELVVLGTDEFLGGFGAVVAAAGAGGRAAKGHALRRAGEEALGEHCFGSGMEWRVEQCGVWVRWACDGEVELTKRGLADGWATHGISRLGGGWSAVCAVCTVIPPHPM